MGIRFQLRQAVYQALSDELRDSSGAIITDRAGVTVTRREPIGLGGVYDVKPPENDPAIPQKYAVIGRQISRAMDTKTTRGYTTLVRIFTYSRSSSAREIEDAQDAIYDALHYRFQPLAVVVSRQGSDIDVGPDGKFYGVCEYLFTILKI